MNKQQAQLIAEISDKYDIEVSLDSKNENVHLTKFSDIQVYSSFDAAKHYLNALIIEQQYLKNSEHDFQNFDLFKNLPQPSTPSNIIVTADESQSVLKIDNKADLFAFPVFLVFTSLGNVCKVQNTNLLNIQRVIERCEMEPGEKPLYVTATKNYSGFMIAAFQNGKVAKISMKSFVTEFNRKKLKNAFNTESKLIFIEYFNQESDLAAMSSINKVMVFNTAKINVVDSRTTKGVQVMKSKDFSLMLKMKRLEQVKFENSDYYRNDSLNVVGYYLKDGDIF